MLKTLLPKRIQETDPSRPRYLDESALETPSLALADAARERCTWAITSKSCCAR